MASNRMLPGIYEAAKRHPGAVIASVGLHVVLLVLLSLSLSSSEVPEQPKPQASTVKAVVVDAAKVDEELKRRKQAEQMKFQHAEASALSSSPSEEKPQAQPQTPFVRDGRKVGRNEPCPCGSGKKFKQCHGRLS